MSTVSHRTKHRAVGALAGLAVGDALGAPVEFNQRDSFPLVTEMQPGGCFNLPAGAWTDDTAMALCLAESLLDNPEFDSHDMLDRFLRWMDFAENTSTGKCIGIGQNTLAVMGNFRRTGALIAPAGNRRSDGNGALMRLAPVAVLHWRRRELACEIAVAQSRATHHSDLSAGACAALATILTELIAGSAWEDALHAVSGEDWPEELRPILSGDWSEKPRNRIESSGYVAHTIEAALWSVGTTASFEAALISAVNLGNDADTVGAVAGQLAGARYGLSAVPERWLSRTAKIDQIISVAEMLFERSAP